MKLKAALPASALLLSLFAATGCTAETGTDELVEDESDLSASRIQQLGSIAPGETKTASYTSSPLYRSFAFTAKKGTTVDFWVRSSTGDAVAYILRSSLSTLVRNDDADATTRDAHVKAKITADGTYYLVLKEAKSKAATFSVTFAPLTPVDPPPPPATSDPFDAASCTGAPLDFVSKFAPGATEAVLGNYQIVLRKRQCNSTTGCTPWQTTSEHAGPSGHGKATLAINPNRLVLVGDEASSAYGTPSIKLGTDCVLGSGTASCNDYYVTETAHGAWPLLVGPRDRHYRVGLDGVGSYHIDGDNVKLSGALLDHCMRLSAHPTGPDEIYPNAPYNDFEAAILVRY
ncbi:MAG: hypothetical protein HOO96_41655 [Polyangiaceae bacterium]|nr:hypothetical protein [Polyangiaceae bacterium]